MKRIALFLLLMIGLQSCREEVDTSTESRVVFESLWKILDEKYCFFESKNVNWEEIHDKYAYRADTTKANSVQLFNLLGEMICELKDGHVNLYSAHNVVRYWKWYEDYAPNFNYNLEKNYLGTDYLISSGLKYRRLNDNVGYITYRSFSSSINDAGLDYIFDYFKDCPGIIIDVRDNSGGNLSNVDKLACRFTEEKLISTYIRHKVGPKHDDFSDYYPIYVEPSPRKRYTAKKVVVLTNRSCFSATNTFVSTMRLLPNVTIMGDRTGGGGGFPISSSLPNGWNVRFSSCPTFNSAFEHIEEGIEPDITVFLDEVDEIKGIDTILEAARSFIKK